MRVGIKGKQVLGVTSIVGTVVVALSVMQLSRLAAVSLNETSGRAQLIANGLFHRAREVVGAGDAYQALRGDAGLRAMIEASLYSENVTYAAITDARGAVVIHSDRSLEGRPFEATQSIETLARQSPFAQLVSIFSGQGRALEYRQPLLVGDTEFGTIRIGVSTLLIRDQLRQALRPAIATTLAALLVSIVGAMLFAQLLLRPIHVISSGLTRLGRGELGVRLDLDRADEFGELGAFFNTASAQIAADRSQMAGQVANLETAVERLEQAAAVESPRDELLSQVRSTIRYSRKLAALGRLSAGVAHEVKNPLNAMMIHLELLRQKIAAAAETGAAQHVDVIAKEIKRLDEVVQGFLKFSRPEDLTLQPVALPALLNEVAAIVGPEAERAGVQVIVDGGGVPDVDGDPAMLRQAFLNLALNAVQAMPDGGTLRLSCGRARDRRVAVRVVDTGVGIRPEHLEKIFNLYFTTKERGSGIGLSMVFRTVQMHDGEIEVESTPGAGTTFTVLLHQS